MNRSAILMCFVLSTITLNVAHAEIPRLVVRFTPNSVEFQVPNSSAMSNVPLLAATGTACGEGGGGEGGGDDDPPILHGAGYDGSRATSFSLRSGVRFRVLLGDGQSPIQLRVFDVRGRSVATIASGEASPGWHTFEWRTAGTCSESDLR